MSTRKISRPESVDLHKVSGNHYRGNDSCLSYYILHGRRFPGHARSLADRAEVGTKVEKHVS